MHIGPEVKGKTIDIETSDHCKMTLQIVVQWQFKIDKSNEEQANALFQVKDFVAYCIQSIAAKIRGRVSGVNFDDFQKNSDEIIKLAAFG